MAATVRICRIRIHQTRVVTAQLAVRVTDRAIPARAAPASQAELQAVIFAVWFHDTRTLCAEGCGDQGVHARVIRNDHWTVQHISERSTRIANVETEVV